MHEKLQDDGKAEQGNRLEVTRYFLAMATNVNDGVLDIWRSRRDLLPYQPHPNSPRLRVASNEPRRREGTLLWDITVQYSAELQEREEDENPLARPAKISWSAAMYQRATLFDADGKPIRNAAGDLFDPQEVEDERWVISVKKNVAAVPKWISELPHGGQRWRGADSGLDLPQGNAATCRGWRFPKNRSKTTSPFMKSPSNCTSGKKAGGGR